MGICGGILNWDIVLLFIFWFNIFWDIWELLLFVDWNSELFCNDWENVCDKFIDSKILIGVCLWIDLGGVGLGVGGGGWFIIYYGLDRWVNEMKYCFW